MGNGYAVAAVVDRGIWSKEMRREKEGISNIQLPTFRWQGSAGLSNRPTSPTGPTGPTPRIRPIRLIENQMKKTAKDKVLILIPVFNEARSIRRLILEIRGLYPEMDILVVDDGSSDDSAEEARAGGAIVISHCFNLGDGAARQTGFLYAIRRGYDFIIHLDGDRQHSPGEISRFIDVLRRDEADLVVGSRFLGEHDYNLSLSKKIGMKLFSTICSLVLRQKITDPTSGFRGINRRAMEVYTSGYYPQHFPDADVIISSHFRGLRIKEIPITVQATQSTSLHRGWTIIYYIYKMLLSTFVSSLRFSRKRNKNK